jgi:hypothetical protein
MRYAHLPLLLRCVSVAINRQLKNMVRRTKQTILALRAELREVGASKEVLLAARSVTVDEVLHTNKTRTVTTSTTHQCLSILHTACALVSAVHSTLTTAVLL